MGARCESRPLCTPNPASPTLPACLSGSAPVHSVHVVHRPHLPRDRREWRTRPDRRGPLPPRSTARRTGRITPHSSTRGTSPCASTANAAAPATIRTPDCTLFRSSSLSLSPTLRSELTVERWTLSVRCSMFAFPPSFPPSPHHPRHPFHLSHAYAYILQLLTNA